jgi:predicted membrane channel-forming protein YqfA (hemolysin III family)
MTNETTQTVDPHATSGAIMVFAILIGVFGILGAIIVAAVAEDFLTFFYVVIPAIVAMVLLVLWSKSVRISEAISQNLSALVNQLVKPMGGGD